MNLNESTSDLLATARSYFREGKYNLTEPILNQMILQNEKSAEVFHMLGTIFYDQGKFNKAIKAFQRALELDPLFTDASVGLSIILNDLGRYEEAQKVFEDAQTLLQRKGLSEDKYVNEKLASKHDELGEMYFHHSQFAQAKEQYEKAVALSNRKAELSMKLVECHLKLGQHDFALGILKDLQRQFPEFTTARLKMGQVYYETGHVPEAVEAWESIGSNDPLYREAQRLLRQVQAIEVTSMFETYDRSPS
jgi:tetratricopeptide (TPR) repeat protein